MRKTKPVSWSSYFQKTVQTSPVGTQVDPNKQIRHWKNLERYIVEADVFVFDSPEAESAGLSRSDTVFSTAVRLVFSAQFAAVLAKAVGERRRHKAH